MVTKVPTLSTSGYAGSVAEKCDRLLSYYIVNDASQSTLYAGQIMSLPSQIQQTGHDEQLLREAVRPQLQEYFSRHFDAAEVDVRTDIPNPDDPNRINLTLSVIVVDNNQRYSAGREIQIQNSTIAKIVELNNEG